MKGNDTSRRCEAVPVRTQSSAWWPGFRFAAGRTLTSSRMYQMHDLRPSAAQVHYPEAGSLNQKDTAWELEPSAIRVPRVTCRSFNRPAGLDG